jgi:thiamine biosynthesis lipoprotein
MEEELFEHQDDFMGTVVTQKIFGKRAFEAYNRVVEELERLESLLSFFKEESDVSRLNKMAGKREVKINAEVIHILGEARKYSQLSQGAFEVTLGMICHLWRCCGRISKVPAASEIDELLSYTGYEKLKIEGKERTAYLSTSRMAVDLGGIGKGFAADAAIEIYRNFGLESAFIDLGGNVKTLGKKPDGTDWVVGLQHPWAPRGVLLGVLLVSGQSVVTSGVSERYFAVNGTRFHHILDPRTGWPANAGLESATVICEESMKADALSTAAFIMGLDKGLDLIGGITGVEAIFVTENKRVYITKGLRNSFFLSDQGANYRLCPVEV